MGSNLLALYALDARIRGLCKEQDVSEIVLLIGGHN